MTQLQLAKLEELVQALAAKARRFRDRSIGEQNTKVSLIEPLLEALGWDIRDPDEVHREFRPTSKDSPVDYALKLLRKPRLFVEAKGLGGNLSDRKWVAQVLGYATVAGVEWCVLTDGDEYCLYNATAPVDAAEKLFCRIRLTDRSHADSANTLDLISRSNMEEDLLDVLWNAHFVDRRVKVSLRRLLSTPDKRLVRLVRSDHPKLSPKEIADSLRRLDIQIESPVSFKSPPPGDAERPKPQTKRKKGRKSPVSFNVMLPDVLEAGLLRAPLDLFKRYKGQVLRAKLLEDGSVEFNGKRYDSSSTAAEYARGSITGRRMHTNGWTFWRYEDSNGKKCELNDARKRLLARRA